MTTPLPPETGQTPPAQTPAAPQPQVVVVPQPGQQYFTADQVEAARQQEKDKLYPELQRQKEQLASFQADMQKWQEERKAAENKLKADQDAAAAAAQAAEEEKLTTKQLLDKREAEWKQQQQEMKEQWDRERAIAAKDRELFALKSFIQRRVAEEVAKDTIAPEFLDYIDGGTEAEVEASIVKAQEKTASIVAGMSGQTPPQLTPGVSPAGFSPSGPLDNLTGTKTYTPEQIAAMSMPEYEKFRAQSGMDRAGNNQGMFN